MNSNNASEVALPANLNNIQILANQIPDSKWAVWKGVNRDEGKLGKVPHKYHLGKLIKIGHNDPSQWVDFNTALKWLIDNKETLSGLGLLVGSNPENTPNIQYSSGLIALDIDNCLDDIGELSNNVRVDVKAAIRALQSAGAYIEISPSGKGLRVIWKGLKPEKIGERWKNFETTGEIYDGLSTRFVTITGNVWKDSPLTIIEPNESLTFDVIEYLGLSERQNINSDDTFKSITRNLAKLSDIEIIQKIKQSRQGKGKKLFDGDTSDYGGDHSSADMALCVLIAKWTDDATQVLRIWGESKLGKRDKFKRKDYQDRTVNQALESIRTSERERSLAANSKETKVKGALGRGDSVEGALALAVTSWGGKIPKTLGAAEKILSLDKRLAGAFAFDEFSNQVLKLQSLNQCLGNLVPKDKEPKMGQCWSDADTAATTLWLESEWGLALKTTQVHEAVDIAARRFTINTVVDALELLKWDGKPRLDTWLESYLNADSVHDTPRYLAAIGRAWMVGTVARAFQPGCKHDHVLTLEGGQGYGKSKAIRTLASAIAPQAYREGLPPLSLGQEAIRSLNGAWIVELAELSFMDKVTTEHVKAFITKEYDSYRLPFGRREVTVPRTVSFAATTNQGEFVKDTAARRYWAFKVRKPIDIQILGDIAHQLWAEAVASYKSGESWWLTDASVLKDAETSQRERLEKNGFDELIMERIVDNINVDNISTYREQALHLWFLVSDSADPTTFNRHARVFADALIRCGFEKLPRSKGRAYWTVGQDLAAAIRKTDM